MRKRINLSWIENISLEENRLVLQEYRYLVHRFVQWMGLTISKSDNETVRQLLLPNFVEECGIIGKSKSHLKLLDELLESIDITSISSYIPSTMTVQIENAFYNTYDEGNTYKSLCVLGPATEAISSHFLLPLKEITLKNFPDAETEYFDIHLSEEEDKHAIDINTAISVMESIDVHFKHKKSEYVHFGISLHKSFWEHMESITSQIKIQNRKASAI